MLDEPGFFFHMMGIKITRNVFLLKYITRQRRSIKLVPLKHVEEEHPLKVN